MASYPSRGDLKDASSSGLLDSTIQLGFIAPRKFDVKKRLRRVRDATHCHAVAATMFGVLVTLLACCIGVFYAYQADVYKTRFSADLQNFGILLEGQVTSIDANEGSFGIAWTSGFSCGSPDVFTDVQSIAEDVVCGYVKTDFNVYIQENGSSSYASTWTAGQYSAASSDFFVMQSGNTQIPRSAADQSFETSIDFDLTNQLFQYRRATPLAYPFDMYKSYITFLLARADNNATLPVVGIGAQGDIPNWSISSKGYQLTKCTNISIDLNSSDDAGTCTATEDDLLQRYVVELSAQRTRTVVAFVALIWLTNWIITLVIIWTTARVVFFGANLSSDLVLVPITALFSIPAVRDFGSYMDVCGFLFNLTLISLCSALVLIVGIKRNFKTVD